jgi:hypothetical protein
LTCVPNVPGRAPARLDCGLSWPAGSQVLAYVRLKRSIFVLNSKAETVCRPRWRNSFESLREKSCLKKAVSCCDSRLVRFI